MGPGFYDSARAVSEYLLFHYGTASEILPYPAAPFDALEFPARCVRECLEPQRLSVPARALDLGCAVGRSSFELARHCEEVVGIDLSRAFVEVANGLREAGELEFTYCVEGELTAKTLARVPAGIPRQRVRFLQADAQKVPAGFRDLDVVLLANLLDRLPNPRLCLMQMARLVKPGGQLIVVSPYTWLPEFTPREHWLGGFERAGMSVRSFDTLRELLSPAFELTRRLDLPFLIREHARKFQWSVSDATVWIRRSP